MPLLVAAAATDQTGRTITFLSVGLLAVALGLTALTIWYWRFTSPRRQATAEPEPAVDPAEPPPVVSISADVAASAPPTAIDSGLDETPETSPALDDRQWESLTRTVLGGYLDDPRSDYGGEHG